MTEEAATAVGDLLTEHAIYAHPASQLVYLIDGRTLSLPIPKSARKLTKPHWLPVTLRTVPLKATKPRRQSTRRGAAP
jgi:hypothetical protein